MPSKSPAQARLMAAVAHGWKPPAKSGISVPVKVAKEFNQADAGRKVGRPRKTLAGLQK